MLHYVFFSLLASAVAALATGQNSKEITFGNKIIRNSATNGIVEGSLSCGSLGQVLQVRVTNCNTLPCDLHTAETYFIEVDFIPIADHTSLNVLISFIVDEEERIVVFREVETAVIAGSAYTVAYPLTVTGSFAQGRFFMKFRVSYKEVVELCQVVAVVIHQ